MTVQNDGVGCSVLMHCHQHFDLPGNICCSRDRRERGTRKAHQNGFTPRLPLIGASTCLGKLRYYILELRDSWSAPLEHGVGFSIFIRNPALGRRCGPNISEPQPPIDICREFGQYNDSNLV